MNRLIPLGLALLLATAASAAIAQEPLTRAQVIADLKEAQRTGDLVTGYSGLRQNEIAPERFPPKPAQPGKTRQQVREELAEALRTGDIVTGYSGLKRHEINPSLYAAARARTPEVLAQTRPQP